MEYLFPFYIPPSAPGSGGSTRISDPGITTELENDVLLYIISGGPVFLWFGRKENADAYAQTHGGNQQNYDFDLAAGIYTPASIRQGSIGMITIASDSETVGFLKIREIK